MSTIDRETLLAAIRECVTVVKPGDVLAVRLPWGADSGREYEASREQIQLAMDKYDVRIAFIEGEEFARIQPRRRLRRRSGRAAVGQAVPASR